MTPLWLNRLRNEERGERGCDDRENQAQARPSPVPPYWPTTSSPKVSRPARVRSPGSNVAGLPSIELQDDADYPLGRPARPGQ